MRKVVVDLIDLVEGVGDEFVLEIEGGAFTTVPIFSTHKRARVWMARVTRDPRAPGGLRREFAERARGEGYYYLVPRGWKVGDFVEFGADYYTGSGKKDPRRWYGVIVEQTPSKWVLQEITLKDIGKVSVEGRPGITLLEEDIELIKELVKKYGKDVVVDLVKSL